MSRPRVKPLLLNFAEYGYLANNVRRYLVLLRKFEQKGKLKGREWKIPIAERLIVKLPETPDFTIREKTILFKKDERAEVKIIVDMAVKKLSEQSIPNYLERINRDIKLAVKYSAYITRAELKLAMLKALSAKLEEL